MIYGPKNDGTYVIEFRTSEGENPGDLDPDIEPTSPNGRI